MSNSTALSGRDIKSVTAHTADFTLTEKDNGTRHTNTAAAGAISGQLPPATPGLNYGFCVGAAQQFKIEPDGTDTVSLPSNGVPGAAGKYLVADAIGEVCYVECFIAHNWETVAVGTWTAEG